MILVINKCTTGLVDGITMVSCEMIVYMNYPEHGGRSCMSVLYVGLLTFYRFLYKIKDY